jgi:ATP-binding cassette subfamily B protein
MTVKQEKVPVARPDLILKSLPAEIRAKAEAAGFTDADCLFCSCADLDLDGQVGEVWLVVGTTQLGTFGVGAATGTLESPIAIKDIQKIRCAQTVGSAFLEVMVDSAYVSLVRYTNGKRELFGRTCAEIKRMVDGKPVSLEALTRPSERYCSQCGLPLPGRGAECTRCKGHGGLFSRTMGLMRPYKWSISLLFAVMLMGVTLDLVPPMLTRMMVDQVFNPASTAVTLAHREAIRMLLVILMVLVGASLGRQLLNMGISVISSLIGTRITKELRERLQAKLIGLNVEYYNRHSVGSLMSRVLYDVDYFQSFVGQVAQGFLLNLLLVLGIGSMLFVMNWKLALLVMLPIPFVAIGTTYFWRHIYPRYYRLSDSQSKMYQLLGGLLNGIRLVKVFGQEEREKQRFSASAEYMQNTRRSLEMSQGVFGPIMGFIFGLGGLIIWFSGGQMVLEKHITLGTLMAFLGYVGMFYGPISSLTMFSNWLTGFLSAGQRVFEVLDSHSALSQDPNPVRLPSAEGSIELKNVVFGYDPYTPVLKGVTMKIEPGQFVGIVGKSGSGKTTLVNLICRFYDVHEGQVLLDGVDVRKLSKDDLHRQVGLVLQEPFLFRASIADNIAYGRPDANALAVLDAAKSANAHDFIARRTSSYDTKLGENGAGLSGGERQRISIARALLCNPRILILDEATSSVDTESEQEIQKALAVICKGRTTIAIAHRLSTLKNADIIFVFDDGRIAESGTHEQLLEKQGIYYKLVMIQTQLTRLET